MNQKTITFFEFNWVDAVLNVFLYGSLAFVLVLLIVLIKKRFFLKRH
ncbi:MULTISPECIES: hypothetical protein [Shouchella]|uniref:Uncharacterized protein n=1 Tax=Shouchella hunanensis TaxID=766894 RepID=A0ABY7WAJ6_9BACI|nr:MULTISPECIES: hypothetical protein [Shouchella]WDF05706.1 hypothetical protein PQ477_09815 [Shouchella hunanensis]